MKQNPESLREGGELPPPAQKIISGKREGFRAGELLLFSLVTLCVLVLCVCVGSVSLPLKETLTVIWNAIVGLPMPEGISVPIILSVRLPRVLCVALTGAALSICGAAMQGLLKNPLADGSTLGVSSGASLGAVLAIAFGITIPSLPFAGTMVLAMGGSELTLPGEGVQRADDREYFNLYTRFADLIERGESDVDLSPLRIVADAFLLAERDEGPAFDW